MLIEGLETQRPLLGVHRQVVLALVAVTDEPEVVVPILVDQLNSSKEPSAWMTRENVIDGLGRMGPKAKASVPALNRWLEEANAKQGVMIYNALRQIEGN